MWLWRTIRVFRLVISLIFVVSSLAASDWLDVPVFWSYVLLAASVAIAHLLGEYLTRHVSKVQSGTNTGERYEQR
jgi:hypothetical protein